MSKKVKIKDLETDKEYMFNTQTEAADWINSIIGGKLKPANILYSIQYGVPVGKKRFKCEKVDEVKVALPKTKHLKKDASGWEFWQYKLSPSVVLAETKVDYYDEEKFEAMRYKLRKCNCHLHYEEEKFKKHSTRIEVYKKYDDPDMLFEDKVADIKRIIHNTIER